MGAPGWMVEGQEEVGIGGRDGVVERERADAPPALEVTRLVQTQAVRLASIGYLDVKGDEPFSLLGAVMNVAHDLVAKIEVVAVDARLVFGHEEAQEPRCTGR